MKNIALIGIVMLCSVGIAQSGKDQGGKGNKGQKQHGNHTMQPKNGGGKIVIGSGHNKGKGGKSNTTIVFNNKHDQNKNEIKSHGGKQMKGHNGKDNFFMVRYDDGHHPKGHSKKNKYPKGHPNYGYFYYNEHGYYSGSNYGYWRSSEAKKKHKHYHPEHEHDAIEVFNVIVVRNTFLLSELSFKINLLRSHLMTKRNAGTITTYEMNRHMDAINRIEKRRSILAVNVVVEAD